MPTSFWADLLAKWPFKRASRLVTIGCPEPRGWWNVVRCGRRCEVSRRWPTRQVISARVTREDERCIPRPHRILSRHFHSNNAPFTYFPRVNFRLREQGCGNRGRRIQQKAPTSELGTGQGHFCPTLSICIGSLQRADAGRMQRKGARSTRTIGKDTSIHRPRYRFRLRQDHKNEAAFANTDRHAACVGTS